jgi:hypothetical protein
MGASFGFRVRAEVEFLQELQTLPRQVRDDEAVRAEVATWPNADGLPKCLRKESVPLFRDEREGALRSCLSVSCPTRAVISSRKQVELATC